MIFYNTQFKNDFPKYFEKVKEQVSREVFTTPELFEKQRKIIEKFIKEKGLIIYGGLAMNKFLPEDKKIYINEEDILTDYDVWSPEPKKDAVILANTLFENGFDTVVVKNGVGQGVFKIFNNFQQAMDLQYIPHKILELIPTEKFDGLKYSTPLHARINAYHSLTNPRHATYRWKKDLERLELLEEEFPYPKPTQCKMTDIQKPEYMKLQEIVLNTIKNMSEILFTGDEAYYFYMANSGLKEYHKSTTKYVEIMSNNSINILRQVKEKLHPKVIIREYNPLLRHVAKRYTLALKSSPNTILLMIYDLGETCVPYITHENKRYVTFDYLLFFYNGLNYLSMRYGMKMLSDNTKCCLYYLILGREHYFKQTNKTRLDDSIFMSLVYVCQGNEKNYLRDFMINNWHRRERFLYIPFRRDVLLDPSKIGMGNIRDISGQLKGEIKI
jgi:hypothetical protein